MRADLPKKEYDAVFDGMDPDGSGSIGYKELQKLLKTPAVAPPPPDIPVGSTRPTRSKANSSSKAK